MADAIKLEVGGVYRKRGSRQLSGQEQVRIVSHRRFHLYDYMDENGNCYTGDGRYLFHRETIYDLVEKVN